MHTSEFSLIDQLFAHPKTSVARTDVILGVGDDCALLAVPPNRQLAVSLDLLVAGTHFFADTDPVALGHKALAVNLSDLAAMGAEPAWVTLGLTLPQQQALQSDWVAQFCQGFWALAADYNVALVGGDTTCGPLSIAVQAHGLISPGQALRRDGARPDDAIFVTGSVGDAALGLAALRAPQEVPVGPTQQAFLVQRLQRPSARVAQSLALSAAHLATAAIDVSDGLAQDLGHILRASKVGARLWQWQLPLSSAALSWAEHNVEQVTQAALAGGDDYELCFTAPKSPELLQLLQHWNCQCSQIGVIERQPGLRIERRDGSPYQLEQHGYDHFTTSA